MNDFPSQNDRMFPYTGLAGTLGPTSADMPEPVRLPVSRKQGGASKRVLVPRIRGGGGGRTSSLGLDRFTVGALMDDNPLGMAGFAQGGSVDVYTDVPVPPAEGEEEQLDRDAALRNSVMEQIREGPSYAKYAPVYQPEWRPSYQPEMRPVQQMAWAEQQFAGANYPTAAQAARDVQPRALTPDEAKHALGLAYIGRSPQDENYLTTALAPRVQPTDGPRVAEHEALHFWYAGLPDKREIDQAVMQVLGPDRYEAQARSADPAYDSHRFIAALQAGGARSQGMTNINQALQDAIRRAEYLTGTNWIPMEPAKGYAEGGEVEYGGGELSDEEKERRARANAGDIPVPAPAPIYGPPAPPPAPAPPPGPVYGPPAPTYQEAVQQVAQTLSSEQLQNAANEVAQSGMYTETLPVLRDLIQTKGSQTPGEAALTNVPMPVYGPPVPAPAAQSLGQQFAAPVYGPPAPSIYQGDSNPAAGTPRGQLLEQRQGASVSPIATVAERALPVAANVVQGVLAPVERAREATRVPYVSDFIENTVQPAVTRALDPTAAIRESLGVSLPGPGPGELIVPSTGLDAALTALPFAGKAATGARALAEGEALRGLEMRPTGFTPPSGPRSIASQVRMPSLAGGAAVGPEEAAARLKAAGYTDEEIAAFTANNAPRGVGPQATANIEAAGQAQRGAARNTYESALERTGDPGAAAQQARQAAAMEGQLQRDLQMGRQQGVEDAGRVPETVGQPDLRSEMQTALNRNRALEGEGSTPGSGLAETGSSSPPPASPSPSNAAILPNEADRVISRPLPGPNPFEAPPRPFGPPTLTPKGEDEIYASMNQTLGRAPRPDEMEWIGNRVNMSRPGSPVDESLAIADRGGKPLPLTMDQLMGRAPITNAGHTEINLPSGPTTRNLEVPALSREGSELRQGRALAPTPEQAIADAHADFAERVQAQADRFFAGNGRGMTPTEYQRMAEAERVASGIKPEQLQAGVLDYLNLPRSMMAGADLSYALRQGLLLGAGHPLAFTKSVATGIHSAFDPDYARQVAQRIASDPASKRMGALYLAPTEGGTLLTREEAYASPLLERIPLLGGFYRTAERGNVTLLNQLRFDVAKNIVGAVERNEARGLMTPNQGQAAIDHAMRFINRATGRGSIGDIEKAAVPLSQVFFSLRNAIGKPQAAGYLNPVNMRGIGAPAWQEAVRDFGALLGVGGTVLALADAAGLKVGTDPRSADFGKIVAGNQHIDIWGGFQQQARAVYQATQSAYQGKVSGVIGANPDLLGATNAITQGGRAYERGAGTTGLAFLGNRLSPQGSFAGQLARGGLAALGDKVPAPIMEVMNEIWPESRSPQPNASTVLRFLTPLLAQDVVEGIKYEGIKGGLIGGLSGLGIGVQTYPNRSNPRTTANNQVMQNAANLAALPPNVAAFLQDKSWNAATPKEQKAILAKVSPEERAAIEKAEQTLRERKDVFQLNRDEARARSDLADENRAKLQPLADKLLQDWKSGALDPSKAVEAIKRVEAAADKEAGFTRNVGPKLSESAAYQEAVKGIGGAKDADQQEVDRIRDIQGKYFGIVDDPRVRRPDGTIDWDRVQLAQKAVLDGLRKQDPGFATRVEFNLQKDPANDFEMTRYIQKIDARLEQSGYYDQAAGTKTQFARTHPDVDALLSWRNGWPVHSEAAANILLRLAPERKIEYAK